MHELDSKDIECPYCGEIIEILIDPSVSNQQYIEDCQVCCRPINIELYVDFNGEIVVTVSSEDD